MDRYLALSEYYLPHKGGHVIWLHETLRRLGQSRVITHRLPGQAVHQSLDGVDIQRINLDRHPWLRPESLAMYARLTVQGLTAARRMRPAAILAARVLPEGLAANIVAGALGVPSVVFAHGEEITCWTHRGPRSRRALTAATKRRLLWRTYRHADRLIANSRFTRDLLTAGGVDPRHIAVIHPGVDPDLYRPAPRDPTLVEQLGLAGRRVILTVGRLSRRKGQDALLGALPAIAAAIPDVVYLIAGDGDHAKVLRDLADSLGVADRVRFLREVPDDQLPAIYNLADLFAMPNRVLPDSQDVEGFGIVFLEAGACGKPVIAGRSGGVPDAVLDNQTGILVDGDDIPAIAAAAIAVLGDPDLADRLGRAARDRVRGELTWTHAADRVGQWIADPASFNHLS